MNIPAEEPTLGDAIFEMGVALNRFNAETAHLSPKVPSFTRAHAEMMREPFKPAKVKTYYDPPPIPMRCHDWHATYDGYEPGAPIGYGRTEAEAIEALAESAAEMEP